MTNFEGWSRLCYKTNTSIWPVSVAVNRSSTGLYMTKGWYWQGNEIKYHSLVWQVWIDDDRVMTTMDSNTAVRYWLKLVKELGLEVENFEQIDMEV